MRLRSDRLQKGLLLTLVSIFLAVTFSVPLIQAQPATWVYTYSGQDTIVLTGTFVGGSERDPASFVRTETDGFTFENVDDENTNDPGGIECIDTIRVTGEESADTHTAVYTLRLYEGDRGGVTGCSNDTSNVLVGNATGRPFPEDDPEEPGPTGDYNYSSSITIVGPGDTLYTNNGSGNFFEDTIAQNYCPDFIEITDTSGADYHDGVFHERSITSGQTCNNVLANIQIGSIENADVDPEADEETCSGLSVLGWLLCPLTTGLLEFIENIFNRAILPHLEVEPLNENSGDLATEAIYDIWNSFRIIANVLFVVVFLVAIFGQGLGGFQVFSAYDFRKILPRLVIGVIGIQLSWYIVGFAVDIFNVLGASVRGLLLAPVEGLQAFDYDFGAMADFVTTLTAVTGVWAVFNFAKSIKGYLLLIPSILLPIAVALIMALVIVLFRKMLIFVLIVASPIAFVMGILPNTEAFLRMWWEYLWKALFMYPIIIAFIAAGELTAKILVAGDESSAGNQVMGMIAMFAPYFLITTTFRLAGSALALASGGLQNAGGGLKEKILGDPRDPTSIRARRRKEFRDARRTGMVNYVNRNTAGMPAFNWKRGQRLKNVGVFGRAIKSGWNRDAKERRNPVTGNRFQLGMGGTDEDGQPVRKAGIAGVIGGMAAGLAVRYGGADIDSKMAAANEESMKWAKAMADYDGRYLMATLGATHEPDGDEIPEHIRAAVGSRMSNPSDVMAATNQLVMWSRDPDTHDWIRDKVANHPVLGTHLKGRTWGDATNEPQVKGLHPNLNSMDVFTGKLIPGKTLDYVLKPTSRETDPGILQRGEYSWRMLGDVHANISDPTFKELGVVEPGEPDSTDRVVAKQKWNMMYDQALRVSEQSFFSYQYRNLLEKHMNAPIEQILSDPDKKAEAYNVIKTQAGLPGVTKDTSDRELLLRHMDKSYSEFNGGFKGRQWFLREYEGERFDVPDESPVT